MNEHEARLHAMLANKGGHWADLSNEDCEAIRWLIDYAAALKDELDKGRSESSRLRIVITQMRVAAEKASADFMRISLIA